MSAQAVTDWEMHHRKWRVLSYTSIHLEFKVSLTSLAKNKCLPDGLLSFAAPNFSPLLERIPYAIIFLPHFSVAWLTCQRSESTNDEVEIVFQLLCPFLSSLLCRHCSASQSQESFQVAAGSMREISAELQATGCHVCQSNNNLPRGNWCEISWVGNVVGV